jgi:membrane-associated phospholipid phosphatase
MDDRGAMLARTAARWTPAARAAVVLSHLGRGGAPWLVAATVVGGGRRELGRAEGTALSSASIAGALLGSSLLARAVGRRRPCRRGVRPLVRCPDGGSFPSDQAAAAFAGAEILGWLAPPARAWLTVGAAAVALARVAVGVHYVTDVVGGGLIGVAIGRVGRAAVERRAG